MKLCTDSSRDSRERGHDNSTTRMKRKVRHFSEIKDKQITCVEAVIKQMNNKFDYKMNRYM